MRVYVIMLPTMNLGFWEKLNKPIMVLAPMADVTDAAFRRVIAKYGKPDVMWTEFVSADGLFRGLETGRREDLMIDLKYSEEERPIIAQFFSPNPEEMTKAGELAVELGFDGIDINMGCPDRKVCGQGSGAALIRTPEKAVDVIRAAKKGAGDLPVSVKTRVGYTSDDEMEEWVRTILREDVAVLTLHARTKKDMSKVPARWEMIKRAVEIRDEMKSKTLIFGNGDVKSLEEARKRVEETGCDGVMIGRGIFGNPWFFAEHEPTLEEKLNVMVEHTRTFEELLGKHKNFAIMKKHYKAYVNGFKGAKELRIKLMETQNAGEVERLVKRFLGSRKSAWNRLLDIFR